MNKQAAKTARKLLPIYRETLDVFATAVAKEASCRRGCAHCCHNLVKATLIEAILLADHILTKWSKEEIRGLKVQLEEQAAIVNGLAAGKERTLEYLKRRVPCVFLDPKKNECRVYAFRPAACRQYFVVTDPDQCSPDKPGARVGYIDASDVMVAFVNRIFLLGSRVPLFHGDLQSILLAAFELLQRTPESFQEWLSKQPLEDV